MPAALFVVSEAGYWGEECAEPLEALTDAGVDVTVATPTGSPPVVDERSVDPDVVGEAVAARVDELHASDDRLNDPIPVAAAADDYDAVVFPGGHGAEWDVNQDRDARRLLRETLEGDGMALVVCHAVGLLAFARDRHGAFLVNGRDVTGFPTEWEADLLDEHGRLPDGRKLPYLVEEEVTEAGGHWDAELDAETSVTVDGDLITARGPESSAAAAETLLAELDLEE